MSSGRLFWIERSKGVMCNQLSFGLKQYFWPHCGFFFSHLWYCPKLKQTKKKGFHINPADTFPLTSEVVFCYGLQPEKCYFFFFFSSDRANHLFIKFHSPLHISFKLNCPDASYAALLLRSSFTAAVLNACKMDAFHAKRFPSFWCAQTIPNKTRNLSSRFCWFGR